MASIEERKSINTGVIQNLVLENREKLSVSGVLDVLSFDDQVVIVETELGLLNIKGNNLKINKISIKSLFIKIKSLLAKATIGIKQIIAIKLKKKTL